MVRATLTVKPSKTAFGMNMQYSWRRSTSMSTIMAAEISESHGTTSGPYFEVKRMRMPTKAPAGPTMLKAESPKAPLTRPPTTAVAMAAMGEVPVAIPKAKLNGTATNVTVMAGTTLGTITLGKDSTPFLVLTINILPGTAGVEAIMRPRPVATTATRPTPSTMPLMGSGPATSAACAHTTAAEQTKTASAAIAAAPQSPLESNELP
mmetsp:Transcript_65636/g.170506  ORF Transcript_65636/g.170506 Transcript_65636/m.170506 type:complete len:207 (-) Transcript_65636:17-637(-)